MEVREGNPPYESVLGSDWMIGLGPSTAATAIIGSQLHIARGPFFGHVRGPGQTRGEGRGCVLMGVWSSRLRPSLSDPRM